MPELPEVETVRRGLNRTIVGKTVETVEIRAARIFANDKSLIDRVLVGAKIKNVERRAKVLMIELSSGYVLVIHLKMTGQLIVKEKAHSTGSGQQNQEAGFVGGHPEKAYEQPLPHKHTHVIISFTDGATLYYNDLRKFGWMKLLRLDNSGDGPTLDEFLASLKLGPEPLEKDFTLEYFIRGLNRKTTIKQRLLDQTFIAGIGNIYADEALFVAKLMPTRGANSLDETETKNLFQSIKAVLELGIKYGGTTMNTYRNVDGTHGGMREHLKAYGRAGQKCSRCGETIVSKKIGQRTATFCPSCQK